MARNYHEEIRKALARQRAAVNSPAQKAERAAAARMPASILSVTDIADTIGDVLATRDREILGHVGRMFKLIELRQQPDDQRSRNLHARITALESELRQLKRGRR